MRATLALAVVAVVTVALIVYKVLRHREPRSDPRITSIGTIRNRCV